MSALRSGIVLGVLGCLLGACSTQPPKVSCEGHLTPINLPRHVAPVSHPPGRSKPATSVVHQGGGAHGR